MTPVGSVDLRVQRVARSALPGVEPTDLLARLGRGEALPDVPLLNPHRPPEPSGGPSLDRRTLADALDASNRRMGHPLSDRAAQAIRGDGTLVVAGQQPGLLLGPLYTLLKAITASVLAGRLSERTSTSVVPAFWVASEDHALEEVNHCVLGGKKLRLDHGELPSGRRPPVGDVPLARWKPTILDFVEQALPTTPHKAWVKQLVEQADFSTYTSAFTSLLPRVLGDPDLILVDPQAIRPHLAPPLATLTERWGEVRRGLAEGSERLRAAGVEPPLPRVNLFELVDGDRTACEEDDAGMTLGGRRVGFHEAAERIRSGFPRAPVSAPSSRTPPSRWSRPSPGPPRSTISGRSTLSTRPRT